MDLVRELLDLVLRWLHVIAAIMWIGDSLLFNWLDRRLLPADRPRQGSVGEAWLLHSGGFYEVEKTLSPGDRLPRPLHWFKWQAYTTWLSGAALLVVVYYMSRGALLVRPDAGLSLRAATALGVGVLVGGLLVYELLYRTRIADAPAALLSFGLLMGLSFGLSRVFTGRAAFLHIGALMGTIMAANVLLHIMPAQRQMVRAVERGGQPDPRLSHAAKRRSIHNNYMTFPVIILMLSNHFPTFHGGDRAWLVVGVLVLGGAGVRHALNVRLHQPAWLPALGATIAATLAALWLLAAPSTRDHPALPLDDAAPVTFEQVERIVQKRCAVCHSAEPADRTFGPTPGGVAFDSPEQIRALAPRIHVRAVETRTMPPGNSTWITEEERAVLARWVEQRRSGEGAD